MASADYTVEFDWDRDDTYGHASSDVSDRVINGMNWTNGMGSSYEEVAPPARLQLTLSNHDGALSQDEYYQRLIGTVPIAYWRLADLTGSVAADSSGNGYDGAITGATLAQTGIGDGHDFEARLNRLIP